MRLAKPAANAILRAAAGGGFGGIAGGLVFVLAGNDNPSSTAGMLFLLPVIMLFAGTFGLIAGLIPTLIVGLALGPLASLPRAVVLLIHAGAGAALGWLIAGWAAPSRNIAEPLAAAWILGGAVAAPAYAWLRGQRARNDGGVTPSGTVR